MGGVLGGVALVVLAVLAFLFIRRRRRRSRAADVAPSAEFMRMAREGTPSFVAFHDSSGGDSVDFSGTPRSHTPLVHQGLLDAHEHPPPFTPGSYTDPVYEKVQESESLHAWYSQPVHSSNSDPENGMYAREAYSDHH